MTLIRLSLNVKKITGVAAQQKVSHGAETPENVLYRDPITIIGRLNGYVVFTM